MTWHNKVIWTEGMFLQPQHFQQQDRFVTRLVDARVGLGMGHAWGFHSLAIDEASLHQGKLALAKAVGVFRDGTPFALPMDELYVTDWNAFDFHMQTLAQESQQTYSMMYAPWGGVCAIPQFIESFNTEFKMLETFSNAEEALIRIPKLKPEIVIMDINLPGMNGI